MRQDSSLPFISFISTSLIAVTFVFFVSEQSKTKLGKFYIPSLRTKDTKNHEFRLEECYDKFEFEEHKLSSHPGLLLFES